MDLTALKAEDLYRFLDTWIAERFPPSEMPFTAEEASSRLARFMRDGCVHGGRRSLVLARVFQSLPFCDLPGDVTSFAADAIGRQPEPGDMFLGLLGTCGTEEDWRDRRKSKSYKAIPLNEETLTDEIRMRRIPMLSRALQQIGVDMKILLGPERRKGLQVEGIGKSITSFHVEKAPGSPYVPHQDDFVLPYGIESVVGCGARLPGGDISLFIGFSRHPIPPESAAAFAPMMVLFWQRVHPMVEMGSG